MKVGKWTITINRQGIWIGRIVSDKDGVYEKGLCIIFRLGTYTTWVDE